MLNPSREIKVPFQVGSDGGIAWTGDRVRQTYQHILSVVLTRVAERVMRPLYGTTLSSTLFEFDDPMSQTDIMERMTKSLHKWEPALEIISIRSDNQNFTDGVLEFLISFKLGQSPLIHTANISMGGTVTVQSVSQ